MKNKKILITGGKGFIGTHLNKLLNEETYDLKDNQDIFDHTKLQSALKGKETVIHLAAFISASESEIYPGKYYSNNIGGVDVVIRAAIKMGVKNFIFASSAAIYNPENPYGLSKLIGEHILSYYKSEIKTISLRYFNVYGKGQSDEYAGVITKFTRSVSNGEPLIVHGNGKQSRDFIAISDLVAIINRIIIKISSIKSGSIFEVGTGLSISINELAKMFSIKFKVPVEYAPNKHVGVFNSLANNKPLLNVIGNYNFKLINNLI